jgi:hypothetical protein
MRAILQRKPTALAGDTDIWMENIVQIPLNPTATNVKAHRISNSELPLQYWQISKKPSKVPFAYRTIILPHNKEEAVILLVSTNGAGIVFSSKFSSNPFQQPFPFGTIWINLQFTGPKQAFAREACLNFCKRLGTLKNPGGYIGTQISQDGSKFSSQSPHVFVLDPEWLPYIASKLNVVIE